MYAQQQDNTVWLMKHTSPKLQTHGSNRLFWWGGGRFVHYYCFKNFEHFQVKLVLVIRKTHAAFLFTHLQEKKPLEKLWCDTCICNLEWDSSDHPHKWILLPLSLPHLNYNVINEHKAMRLMTTNELELQAIIQNAGSTHTN